MLNDHRRNLMLQLAIDKVKNGKEPAGENIPETEEEWKNYRSQVKDLRAYMDLVGPEKFSQTTFEVDYDE